eukprot:scaffold20758_cov28-Tisochrysis_lutea.AAC.5
MPHRQRSLHATCRQKKHRSCCGLWAVGRARSRATAALETGEIASLPSCGLRPLFRRLSFKKLPPRSKARAGLSR